MKPYTVLYRIESIMTPLDAPFSFVCDAVNTDHAEEQCQNAYPECNVMWIVQTDQHAAALEVFYSEGLI